MSYGKPGLNEEQIERMYKAMKQIMEQINGLYAEVEKAVPINSTAFNRFDKVNSSVKSLTGFLHNQYYLSKKD